MSLRPDQPVARVMSWPVASIDHDATLVEAAEALAADSIGALLVLRDSALVGIISERDLVAHVAAGTDLSHLLTGEAMAGDLVTVQTDATIVAAARAMVEADVRHLPVMEGNLIAGVVSVRDIVAVLAAAVSDDDVVVAPRGS
jgi:CBS domain-containing protein